MEEGMSGPLAVTPVMPMVSVIYRPGSDPSIASGRLTGLFGEPGTVSEPYPFDLSGYYGSEMGEGLERIWMAFRRLRDPSELPDWKVCCHGLEMDMVSEEGGRTFNLDPGYLDFGKLVLASFKEAPDKIYMGKGVWAHICLRFGHGSFSAPDHSFPDFRDGRFDSFMLGARSLYRDILRSTG